MASQTLSLTQNSIAAIANGNSDLRPLLQVLGVKEIGSIRGGQTRYRLLVSDGSLVQQAVLATQLNSRVSSGEIKKGTIVQLQDYVCNVIRDLKIIMVLNLEVISFCSETIGQPQQFPQNLTSSLTNERNQEPLNQVGPSRQEFGSTSTSNSSGRPVVSSLYEPVPEYSNKGPIIRNQAPAKIVPIAALNPYQGRWSIKARVTAKGDLRRFHNVRGDGKVFHFDLLDADGGEIRATCFNSAADKFFNEIEVGHVYTVSKGSLKPAQKNFNHLKNDWEIFLESSSIVEQCREDDECIPQQQFNFIPITEIENLEGNMMVDVIGVVIGVGPTSPILRKNGLETQKRTAEIRDMSGGSIELTMWGSFCAREGNSLQEMCNSGNYPVLAIKAGRISDFSGKSVATISTTQLLLNPSLPQATELKNWFEKEGKSASYHSVSRDGGAGARIEMRKMVTQIKDEGLGRSNKADWICVKGTISYIKTDTFCYTACPLTVGDRQCTRKVLRSSDGTWRCDRCDKSFAECEYRYLLSLQIQDHTGVTWVTAFQEAGEEIVGVTAKELYIWKLDEDPRFDEAVQRLMFTQSLFMLKVKEENYQNDELRVKCTVLKTERIDFEAESKVLLDLIGKLMKTEILNCTGLDGFLGAVECSKPPMGYNTGFPIMKFGENNPMSSGNTMGGSCYKCGQSGHWARECPRGRKRL